MADPLPRVYRGRCTVCGALGITRLGPSPFSGHIDYGLCDDCLAVWHSGIISAESGGATLAIVTRRHPGLAYVGMDVDRQPQGVGWRIGAAWRALTKPEPVNRQGVPLSTFPTVMVAQVANRLLLALGALNKDGDGGVWPAAVPVVATTAQRHDPAPVEHYRWGGLTVAADVTCTQCGAPSTLTARDTVSHEGGWEGCPGACGLERRVAVFVRERAAEGA